MIQWPAIIKHDGEDELIYIHSKKHWLEDEEMLLYIFSERDVLIDATGKVFPLKELQQDIEHSNYLVEASLDNIVELIQHHASIVGNCCSSKIQTENILAAIEMVRTIKQES
ncbi:DUF4144 family protein [Thalassotalea crassostreae]|uniref:DUF4144 family protein n=1 Tax=Thalassotalea crassostreae TaxID=1763536 RepID=UPI000838322E|nr:DUF4144 family protein [Thalassotalea crassostreae]